jgi:hypothetical protein
MTKAEHARLMAWRFKVLQQACKRSRNVARTCAGHYVVADNPKAVADLIERDAGSDAR